MIKDVKGRKWMMRFRQYSNGWHWKAKHKRSGLGQEANRTFKTKALAEEDARRNIQDGSDAIAQAAEYFRRVGQRGAECQLTAEDHKAIWRAGER